MNLAEVNETSARKRSGNLDETYRKYLKGKYVDKGDFDAVTTLWSNGFLKMCLKDGKAYAIDSSKEVEAEIIM